MNLSEISPADKMECTYLFEKYGNLYDEAQRFLERSGWAYLIQLDAWVRPEVVERLRANG